MNEPKRLSSAISVAPQIEPSDMRGLAQAGFRSVISNRPDGEEPGQPSWSEIAQAAREAGLEARHIPVVPGAIGDEDVTSFADALGQMPQPVLAFCRTGTRSATLWALSSADDMSPDAVISAAARAGYDLSSLRPRLAKD